MIAILFEWACPKCGSPIRIHELLAHHTLRYSARSRVSNHLTQRHGNLSVRERSEICDAAVEYLSLPESVAGMPTDFEEDASPERPLGACVCAPVGRVPTQDVAAP